MQASNSLFTSRRAEESEVQIDLYRRAIGGDIGAFKFVYLLSCLLDLLQGLYLSPDAEAVGCAACWARTAYNHSAAELIANFTASVSVQPRMASMYTYSKVECNPTFLCYLLYKQFGHWVCEMGCSVSFCQASADGRFRVATRHRSAYMPQQDVSVLSLRRTLPFACGFRLAPTRDSPPRDWAPASPLWLTHNVLTVLGSISFRFATGNADDPESMEARVASQSYPDDPFSRSSWITSL